MISDNSSNKPTLTPFDQLLSEIGHGLRICLSKNQHSALRPSPARSLEEPTLTPKEAAKAAALMRVNHSGEIAAQALYRGQAITASNPNQQAQMLQAADEEIDHLAWCETRLSELNDHTSHLAPIWYIGSFTIGAIAGLAGDHWSLGFVEETEKQVSDHLASHHSRLPEHDHKSHAIIAQMRRDELQHAEWAKQAGASELPKPIKYLMKMTAKAMTKSSYHL